MWTSDSPTQGSLTSTCFPEKAKVVTILRESLRLFMTPVHESHRDSTPTLRLLFHRTLEPGRKTAEPPPGINISTALLRRQLGGECCPELGVCPVDRRVHQERVLRTAVLRISVYVTNQPTTNKSPVGGRPERHARPARSESNQ